MPTSAFGALATTVPSASRTTMSRKRNEVRPFSSRSICVPPTVTVCLPPKFFSIAAFSHGVAMSSSIGPLASRHHKAGDGNRDDGDGEGAGPERAAHPRAAHEPDRAAAHRAPAPAPGTLRRMMRRMVPIMMRARTMAGRMLMVVVARCHALGGAPHPTRCA